MYKDLIGTIDKTASNKHISEERKTVLQPLVDFIQQKVNNGQETNLNFICTHNSRRSHLAQVWAKVASAYYNIPNVHCYSGGSIFSFIKEKVSYKHVPVSNNYRGVFKLKLFGVRF